MRDFENCKRDLLSCLQGNPLDGATEELENRSVCETSIVVKTFCGLQVLRVLAKEI